MPILFSPDSVFLQRFLRAGGYYKDDIDGLVGPRTQEALALFEADSLAIKTELGTFDSRTERAIQTMLPPAQRTARKFMKAMGRAVLDAGLRPRLISGTRTFAEQDALYAQGRTKSGEIVTNARGGQSNHNFGIAWDVGLFTSAGEYLDALIERGKKTSTAVKIEYRKIGPIAHEMHLFWGGDWSKPDRPHVQMLSNDLLASIREKFRSGGVIV